jgi:hypothetical protein
VESWHPTDDAHNRERFVGVPVLQAVEPGSELRLEFSGTAVGLFVTAGPDVGILEYSVDGGAPKRLDQFTEWSERLHIPWAYMLESELETGKHELVLSTTDAKNEKSRGHAIRIMEFLVN